MGWVYRRPIGPVAHCCEPPPSEDGLAAAAGYPGDLWRCDECGCLWRVDQGQVWEPATWRQRLRYWREGR